MRAMPPISSLRTFQSPSWNCEMGALFPSVSYARNTYQGISRCLATQDRRNHAAELVICEMEFIDMNLTSISRVPLKTA